LQASAPPVLFRTNSWAFQFYSNRTPLLLDSITSAIPAGTFVYLDKSELHNLYRSGIRYSVIEMFQDFHVSMLTADFLNPTSRQQAVRLYALIKILPKHE